jgi:hypothetical protein
MIVHRLRVAAVAAAVVVGGVLVTVPTGCGGVVLGAVLAGLTEKVESAVDRAGETAEGAIFDGGTTVTHAIDDVRVAYADALDETVSSLDDLSTKKIQELESIVDEWVSAAQAETRALAGQAQQIANTMPLASKSPQIRSFGPHFASMATADVDVRISGNFPQVLQPGYAPTLTVGGAVIEAAEATTQSLAFIVPVVRLAPSKSDAIVPNTLTLTVPYRSTFSAKRAGTFRLLIGSLPPSPGSFRLIRTVDRPVALTQHVVGPTYTQDSDDLEDKENVRYQYRPDDGWQIKPTTAQFVDEWHRGRQNTSWSWQWSQLDSAGIEIAVSTWWKVAYANGGLRFHVEFDETRSSTVTEEQVTDMTIPWGGQLVYVVEPNRWRIDGTLFGGEPFGTGGPDTNRFLTIRVTGNTVVVTAHSPDSVALPEQA